jgi:hypothetical protein
MGFIISDEAYLTNTSSIFNLFVGWTDALLRRLVSYESGITMAGVVFHMFIFWTDTVIGAI